MEIIKTYKDYIDAINEGYIRTHDLNKIGNYINDSLKRFMLSTDLVIESESFILKIGNFNKIHPTEIRIIIDLILSSAVNMGGYFISNVKIVNLYGKSSDIAFDYDDLISNYKFFDNVEFTFEANFDKLEANIPSRLYHLSVKEYETKILRYGLYPKSKNKLTTHLDRIFVCKSKKDCEDLIPKMTLFYKKEYDDNFYTKGNKKYKKDTTPIIFEIDNSEQFIKNLYHDPNYPKGYYLLENIEPKYLTILP